MNYLCPRCQRPIPLDDINVGKDLALCRGCGQAYGFSELAFELDTLNHVAARPPQGSWFRKEGRDFEVGASTRSWSALFLIPFTLFWSGISMSMIYGTQITKGHFDWKQSLFGLPFLLGTCFLVPACLMLAVGHVAVRVRDLQGEIFTGVGFLGWRRRFPWTEVTAIRLETVHHGRRSGPTRKIRLETPKKQLAFASALEEMRQNFLVAMLRQQLIQR